MIDQRGHINCHLLGCSLTHATTTRWLVGCLLRFVIRSFVRSFVRSFCATDGNDDDDDDDDDDDAGAGRRVSQKRGVFGVHAQPGVV